MPPRTRSSQRGQIEDVAKELAGNVASAIIAANPGSDPPVVRVGEGSTITGEITIEIIYNETTYALTAKMPGSSADSGYEFDLTMQSEDDEEPEQLAYFFFKDSSTWMVEVGLPEWEVTDTITIKTIKVTVESSPVPGAPGAPSDASATAGDASAVVTWTAPGSDGGSAITSYTVTPYAGSEAQEPVEVSGSPPETSTPVSGLTNGTSYTFTVSATNANGTGPHSAPSSPVTPSASLPNGPSADVAPA